jgi:hypothetical protein
MKLFPSFCAAFFVSMIFSLSVQAAPAAKGKPTYESCNALAAQRGFGPDSGSRPTAKRDFMADCMAGKIK